MRLRGPGLVPRLAPALAPALAPVLAPVLAAALLTACGPMTAGPVTPRPMVSLAASRLHLALALSPEVPPDRFKVDCGPAPGQLCTLHVTGFHGSLERGFAAAFRPFYPLVREDADLTLRLQRIVIQFDPAQRLILRYAAELVDRDGRTLGRSFGSLPAIRLDYPPEAALTEALTRMFEKIAAECFAPLATPG